MQKAESIAKEKLNAENYKELAWPLNIEEYIDYLIKFSRHIPEQNLDHRHEEIDDVPDRFAHFYWLVNQEVNEDGITLQENEWFSWWLVRFARVWGDFLDSTDSFNEKHLEFL